MELLSLIPVALVELLSLIPVALGLMAVTRRARRGAKAARETMDAFCKRKAELAGNNPLSINAAEVDAMRWKVAARTGVFLSDYRFRWRTPDGRLAEVREVLKVR